jgi:Antitoxin MazE-like
MPNSTRASRDKVRAPRERSRRQGLRPIQIWVPDVRSPAFEAEAHRQSLAVAQSQHEAEDQAFIDAISDGEPQMRRGDPRNRNARLQDLTPKA